jgi:putative serine protease PepD
MSIRRTAPESSGPGRAGRARHARTRLATLVGLALAAAVTLALSACAEERPAPPAAEETPPPTSTPTAVVRPDAPGARPGDVTSVARALEQEFAAVVEHVNPSVVLITTPTNIGSGVVFDDAGNIVTNAHVVGSGSTLGVVTADGTEHRATLVGTFPLNDLAVVNVEGGAGLSPATFADSNALRVGDVVLAIGNPLGLQSSVTEGIVSATGRILTDPTGAALPDVIQTSAAINPGNSGGALVNLDGQVVGIPTLAAMDPGLGGAAPGIGFAIPSNTVTDISSQLIEHGTVVHTRRAYLGIEAGNVMGRQGVLVHEVVPDGPADRAGIEPGSLITNIAGAPIPDRAMLASVLAALEPGDPVVIELTSQDGRSRQLEAILGELPGG